MERVGTDVDPRRPRRAHWRKVIFLMSNPPDTRKPGAGKALEIDVHVIALKHFERALQALNAVVEDIEAGKIKSAPDVKVTTTDVRKAMQVVFEERKRSDDAAAKYKTDATETGAGVDLEEAKTEIERRLARIRAARDAG